MLIYSIIAPTTTKKVAATALPIDEPIMGTFRPAAALGLLVLAGLDVAGETLELEVELAVWLPRRAVRSESEVKAN